MYRLEWVESAMLRLAEAWTQADSPRRAALTAAANRIDALLIAAPLEAGESREADRRLVIDDPLAAVYEINDRLRLVTVLDVLIRKPTRERD